jgi:hypothetical protein
MQPQPFPSRRLVGSSPTVPLITSYSSSAPDTLETVAMPRVAPMFPPALDAAPVSLPAPTTPPVPRPTLASLPALGVARASPPTPRAASTSQLTLGVVPTPAPHVTKALLVMPCFTQAPLVYQRRQSVPSLVPSCAGHRSTIPSSWLVTPTTRT